MQQKGNCVFILSAGPNKGNYCNKTTSNPHINNKFYCGKLDDVKSHYYKNNLPETKVESNIITKNPTNTKNFCNIIDKINSHTDVEIKFEKTVDTEDCKLYFNDQFKILYNIETKTLEGSYCDTNFNFIKFSNDEIKFYESLNFIINPAAVEDHENRDEEIEFDNADEDDTKSSVDEFDNDDM